MVTTLAVERPILNVRYDPRALWRMLEGWAEYRATGRRPRRTWSEEGAIAHHVTPTEAPFCAGAVEFADLDDALDSLATLNRQAVALYWRDGLRSIRAVAAEMRVHMDVARPAMWDGTERLIVKLCGLTPAEARAECRLYRQWSLNTRIG